MIPWGKPVAVEQLAAELRVAGITGKMSTEGYLRHPRSPQEGEHGLTPAEQQTFTAVVAAHRPMPVVSRWQQHHDRIDTYGLPELRGLLREMLAERLIP